MAIAAGTRFGPYEIVEPIGAAQGTGRTAQIG
jgi:hypothetical protein